MLTVISPAKSLDFESPAHTKRFSDPVFLSSSRELITELRKQSPAQISKLMKISPKLGELNAQRYKAWKPPFTPDNAKQALLAFRGDVYMGLDADTLTSRDLTFSQKHLRILSGLYGVLKPLDLIQPYRLEMGTRFRNKRGKDLYEFWGERLTTAVREELSGHRNKTLVNLASNEYFRSIDAASLGHRIVTPVFKDYSNGTYRILSFFAKRARGRMASHIIRERINKPEDLKRFDLDGYRFAESLSDEDTWVFTRKGV